MKAVFYFLAFLLLSVGIPSNADTSPRYRLVILPLMFGTAPECNGGINAHGQIVGTIIVKHNRGQDGRTALWQAGHPVKLLDRMGGVYPSGETLQEYVSPTGINLHGKAVGVSNYVANGAYLFQTSTACILEDGDVESLQSKIHLSEDMDSYASGINDQGEIVGSYRYNNNTSPPNPDEALPAWTLIPHAYLIRHGHERALWAGDAVAINNRDWIVGTLYPGSPPRHPAAGVLWRNGHTTRLPMQPEAINENGETAGRIPIDNKMSIYNVIGKACVWRHGYLVHLSHRISDALALNNRSQVVGFVGDPNAVLPTRAILWQHGYEYDLNRCATLSKNYILTDAIGVNDHGWIIGRGIISGPPKTKGASTTFTYLLIPR